METTYRFHQVFIAACLGMLLFGIILISVGSILPSLIDKYHFTTIQVGTLTIILPIGILLGSIAFGPIVDRFSYKYMLVVSAILVYIGLEGMAFAPGLTVLQVSVLLIGIGGGALNGGTNAMVADVSANNPEKRSANLSLLGVFFGVGALGVPVLLAALSSQVSFERIISFLGFLSLMPILYFLMIKYPKPKLTQSFSLKSGLLMMKNRYLLILAGFLFLESAIEGVINNWSTTFLQETSDMPASTTLIALSIYVLSLTLGRLTLVVLLRFLSSYNTLVLSIGLLMVGSGLLCYVSHQFLYFLSFVILGFGSAAGFPVILGYVGELYHELRGTAFSFVFFVALVGNATVNYIMGLASQYAGLMSFPWIILSSVILLLVLALAGLRPLVHQLKQK